MISARIVAAETLTQILRERRSLDDCLPERLSELPGSRDRAFTQELCYGVMRWLPRLDRYLEALMRRPLRERDTDVRALLLLGLYQLEYMRVPPHAAVAETVGAVDPQRKPWARGLVNGVLRSFLRQRETLGRDADDCLEARYAHPRWLIDQTAGAWPTRWREILTANNGRPPMSLRVNQRRMGRDAYARLLGEAGMTARPAPHADHGLILGQPVDVAALPGFEEGSVSVQDAAAQLAATLIPARPGARILDACAAPGGKTAHLLERSPLIAGLTALDRDRERLRRLGEGLRRLRLEAELVCGDATTPEAWWDGAEFDHILLDAPCTATGVIRRHPDIKFLRRGEEVHSSVARQAALLDSLWPLLARSGTLVYATCSILSRENADQIVRFLDRHPDAELCKIERPWGVAAPAGRQILPGDDDMDGFYYAVLQKR